ncbi:hypothetical protein IW140_002529 [Coemansia sp. RSA 1813]|nr:hypothetical protein LPJ74_003882 [Coemansia sp. RSA 1843]KAJ2215905.1 hypothetical protein EV179_001733 [Coemansia sp. RSA 487]KAJ2570253.1 hypothetical protein IW140_002529 [Coemansia sp. RSA 1813]
MARPNRRHARKASATTAEEILLPAELMKDLTSSLSPPVLPTNNAELYCQQKLVETDSTEGSDVATPLHKAAPECESFVSEDFIPLRSATNMPTLDLAPLFPVLEVDEQEHAGDISCVQDSSDTLHSEAGDGADASSKSSSENDAPIMPERGILKETKRDEVNGSLWSLWPGAKKWFSESLLPGSRSDIHALPTFAQGAGIPAARQSTEDAAVLSRTAPSIDFERSTNIVPPLSQERIKSTEFWSNFSLELDPTTLKRIRFSMPLIVTEFDPETSRVCDPHKSPSTSVETTTAALRNCVLDDEETPVIISPPIDSSSQDDDENDALGDDSDSISPREDIATINSDESPDASELGDFSGHLENSLYRIISAASQDGSTTSSTAGHRPRNASRGRSRTNSSNSQDSNEDSIGNDYTHLPLHRKRSLQWDVEALSSRQYRVKEVWELYDRTCRSLDIEPLESFENVLLTHVREERTLGSLDLAGSQINGVHMKCFADMLDLNFGLVKLELSHCGIDDDAVRLLTYSLLCNDSVRYLSLANNPRIRSDGIRYISILVRHSKQLQLLDISGIAIRKKSAGYLAAALAGLGANWSLGRGSMHKKSTMCEQISLQALRMNSCGIKPAALAILASGVRLSPLQHLSLRLNSLNGSAGPILREMLYGDPPQLSPDQNQPHLRRPVSVSLHGLSDAQHCSDSALQPSAEGNVGDSPRVSQLRSLDLSQNDLGRAVMDLAEGLLWNTNLRSLLLRQNKLQTSVFSPFMECLGINKGLAYLDISRNPVCGPSPVVLEVLSQVVSQNQTLKALFMSATSMTSEGAIILAECLPELHCLERLDVSENPGIEVAGLMALSASIKLNKSLICVEITVNTGDDVCAALEQGIAQTCIANMQRLDVSSAKSDDSEFGFGLASAQVCPHAEMAPESDIPGVLATKISGENDRYECTSLVTDISAVKRGHPNSVGFEEHDENDNGGMYRSDFHKPSPSSEACGSSNDTDANHSARSFVDGGVSVAKPLSIPIELLDHD